MDGHGQGDWAEVDPATIYPAVYHFRVIVGRQPEVEVELRRVLEAYDVTSPLAEAAQSRTGRYRSLQVAVRVVSRDELVRVDGAMRAVAGVRLIL